MRTAFGVVSNMKFYVSIVVIIMTVFVHVVSAQSKVPDKPSWVDGGITAVIYQKTFDEALAEISRSNHIPIGLQITNREEPDGCKQPVGFNLSKVTLAEALNSLIARCPVYSWSIQDRVVNVVPSVAEDSLLDVRLPKLAVEKITVDEIVDSIFKSSAISSAMRLRNVKRDDWVAYPRSPRSTHTYSLTFTDRSFRSILNSLLTETDNKYWILFNVSTDKGWIVLNVF